jgi:hypothetical protein
MPRHPNEGNLIKGRQRSEGLLAFVVFTYVISTIEISLTWSMNIVEKKETKYYKRKIRIKSKNKIITLKKSKSQNQNTKKSKNKIKNQEIKIKN